jgi:hypothetical protein
MTPERLAARGVGEAQVTIAKSDWKGSARRRSEVKVRARPQASEPQLNGLARGTGTPFSIYLAGPELDGITVVVHNDGLSRPIHETHSEVLVPCAGHPHRGCDDDHGCENREAEES